MAEEPLEVHEIRLPNGRVGRLRNSDYVRLEALAAVEGLSVTEWLARELEQLERGEGSR